MSTHHQVTRLLPWYVNGSLNEREMAVVTAHLEACGACREALDADVQEARALHSDADEARVTALIARRGYEFEALKRRIHATPGARAVSLRELVAVAALLAVTVAIPAVWVARTNEPTLYELQTTTSASAAPVLQVVFRNGTSAQDIELLVRASGTPLGPPSAHGVYRIALATDDPQALLERLRSHPAVRWAEIEL